MKPVTKRQVELVIKRKEDTVKAILNTGKKQVLDEFEKICPTDMSFQRIKKDMHDIFDALEAQLSE